MASAATVISGGSHDCALAASATSRAGIRCASLASSIAASATGPASTTSRPRSTRASAASATMAAVLSPDTVSPIESVPGSPSACARRSVITRWGSTGAQRRRKAASRVSVMPSIGRASTAMPPRAITTGRPERNSAMPRSTATCSGLPSRPASRPTSGLTASPCFLLIPTAPRFFWHHYKNNLMSRFVPSMGVPDPSDSSQGRQPVLSS